MRDQTQATLDRLDAALEAASALQRRARDMMESADTPSPLQHRTWKFWLYERARLQREINWLWLWKEED